MNDTHLPSEGLGSTRPSRRTVLRALAYTGAGAAFGTSLIGCSAGSGGTGAADVAKGPGPGGYALDLGGYQGPVPRTSQMTLRVLRADTSPPVNDWYAKAFAAFHAAFPNIKIAEERVPFGSLQQKVQVYIQSGDAPDIMMGRTDLTAYYGAGKLAVPLGPYLTADFVRKQRASVVDGASVNGDLLVMPWEDGIPMVVFNLDLFAKAKVDPPAELTPRQVTSGWTVDDFLATLGRLKEGLARSGDQSLFALEASTLGNGGPGSNYGGFEGHFIRMMGDPQAAKTSDEYRTWAAVDEAGRKASGYLDSNGAIQGMRNYQKLFQDGLTPKGAVPKQFAGGQAAMGWEAIALINRYTGSPADKLKFEWGATVVPRGTTFFGCNQAEAPFVWTGSKNQAEAVALLAFLCNDKNRVGYHTVRGSVPARDDIIPSLPVYAGKAQQLGLAAAKHFVGAPKTAGWSDYSTAANSAIRNIALGADVATTLHETATKVDGLLKKYR
ncbi:extracellular solute-binding protein [Actinomadura graeca]|uniref:Extracellular solute-binding protein n=1 Tax=Actinomadura graeca TaxID=2750812 RepID=A0ABX8QYA1_9ACTN|nr:extracellular solute-binding protein [Actinomadura graeca]QXJ23819.1 extracellular solute-binding protein [Actinomadura graeca]